MARFLTVLKPRSATTPAALIEALQPLLQGLQAEVDHRTTAHLSALLRGGQEQLRMQLFADVQSKADGRVLEVVVLSREAMGSTAPHTRQTFERLLELIPTHVHTMALSFRSDRDGPLPTATS